MLYFTMPELIEFVKSLHPLLLPIIGGAIAISGQQLTEFLKRKHDRESLGLALVSEMESIMALITGQNYPTLVEKLAEHASQGKPAPMPIYAERTYTQVYEANLEKIGLLGKKSVLKVVRFYALVNSTLEDLEQTTRYQKDNLNDLTPAYWELTATDYRNFHSKLKILLDIGFQATTSLYYDNLTIKEKIEVKWKLIADRRKKSATK